MDSDDKKKEETKTEQEPQRVEVTHLEKRVKIMQNAFSGLDEIEAMIKAEMEHDDTEDPMAFIQKYMEENK